MRRLPVYVLINNSSSMQGEGIEAANAGLSMLISSLRQNPYALESVYLRIHSYAKESQTILPLMSLEDVQFHNLQCSQFSESNLGHSLEELEIIIRNELNQGSIMTKKADWSPLLILITDGTISDSEHFYNILPKFKRINFADILILIVGYGKNLSFLKIKELSKNIVQMDTMDSNNFSAFFKWVSQNIENNSQGILEKNKTYELESKKDKRKSNFEILKNLIAKKEEKLSLKKSEIIQEPEIKKEEKEEEISSSAQIIEIELIEESIKQSNLIHNRSFKIERIAIDFPYDDIAEFCEERAKVKYKWKYGFIDANGKEIIPPIYDDCYNFSEGLAAVCKNGRWGFVDIYGREIIPFLYTKVSSFKEGLAAVNKEGKGIFLSEGKWGFIEQNGMEVIPAIYNSVCDFSEGLAGVAKVEKISNATKIRYEKFGFINKNAEEFIPLIYENISNFSEGLAKIYIGGKSEDPNNSQIFKDGRWGFIDKNGNQIIHTPYSHNDFVDNFSEGLAIYKTMGKWGVIDKNAREIIHPYYDYMHKFSQGLAAIKFNNKWGFVDRNANELIKPIYSWVSPNGFKENLVAVNLGGNKNSLFFDGGRWGFVNLSGEKVIAIKYDFVGDFNNGLALVNLGGYKNGYGFLSGGKNGFIDKNGREIINLYYDEAKNFKENKALVKKNERWYILKKEYN